MTSAFLLAKVIISQVYILLNCLVYFVVFLEVKSFRVTPVMLCGFLLFKLFSQGAFGYVLPIISFILAWIETWFLDFKVLPQEAEEENSKLLLFPLILAVFDPMLFGRRMLLSGSHMKTG